MPINYFANRDEDSMYPDRINVGDEVLIIEKENQGTRDVNDLVWGTVTRKLSKGNFYRNGAKVMITLSEKDWRFEEMGPATFIGRIQYIISRIDDKSSDC